MRDAARDRRPGRVERGIQDLDRGPRGPAREEPRAVRGLDRRLQLERPRGDLATREQAARLAADGVSQRQIAAQLGKHPTTIGRWLAAPDEDKERDPS